jgi:hypothetical protein
MSVAIGLADVFFRESNLYTYYTPRNLYQPLAFKRRIFLTHVICCTTPTSWRHVASDHFYYHYY